jgi:putative transcriptional regulator
MPKKYKSEALAALHESMSGLHDIGIIPVKTMRTFDESCLTAVKAM